MDFLIKYFFTVTTFFNCNALECVLMNNQECRIRPQIISINSIEPLFYPYSIQVNKCSCSCNNINDPYATLCVPDVVKNMNVKVFNLMSRTNETRHMKWHETCRWKCRLDTSVFNNKQRWIIMINADVNAKNSLIMEDMIKDLIGVLVIVDVNVINYVMLESIYIIKIVNPEKD